MADQLITGTTLVEKESRSIGDIPVGGFVEWDDTFGNLPDGYVLCDGSTINDPLSAWNGTAVQNLNTEYSSIHAFQFQGIAPEIDDVNHLASTGRTQIEGTITNVAGVNLPNGVIITAVEGYHINAADKNWTLAYAAHNSGTATVMATGLFGAEDTTITGATIDNNTNRYWVYTDAMESNDYIYSIKFTYTPRNKFIMRTR